MRRRNWLKLGVGAAAVLAIGGGAVSLLEPGLKSGRLGLAGRTVMSHVSRALLDGSLPEPSTQRSAALSGLLDRVDAIVVSLPPYAQQELSQLLALLATGAGRRLLAGLAAEWEAASVAEIQQALQSMRVSSILLRRQAYQALHAIVGSAYFSDPATWPGLGYPGPSSV